MNDHVDSQLIDALIDRELDPSEREAVKRHIRSCVPCRTEFESAENTARAIGSLPRTATPGLDLWPGIEARGGARRPASRRWVNPLAIAAQIVLVVIVGAMVARLLEQSPADTATRRDERAARAIRLLEGSDPWDNVEGAELAAGLKEPGDEVIRSLLNLLESSRESQVRLVAATAIHRHAAHPIVRAKLARTMLAQDSAVVELEILHDIVAARPDGAVNILRTKLDDSSLEPPVRNAIELAIEELR